MKYLLDSNMSRNQAKACVAAFERAVCHHAHMHPLKIEPDGNQFALYLDVQALEYNDVMVDWDGDPVEPDYGTPVNQLMYVLSLVLHAVVSRNEKSTDDIDY